MKYYSEELDKVFDTEEALNAAEKEKAEKEAEKAYQLAKVSKEKKALAKAIDDADNLLGAAYDDLDVARDKATELQKETLKKIEEILRPAEEAVKKAQANKYEAVRKFNDKFGGFTTTLTGAKAAEEFSRTAKYIDNIFNHLFF